MKNIKRFWTILICVIILCSCTQNEKTESVDFDETFCDSIVEIQFVSFEDEIEIYSDKETILELLNILKEAKLEEKKKEDYVEGMWTLYLKSEESTTKIGFTPGSIAINNVQFDADEQIKANIFKCLNIK